MARKPRLFVPGASYHIYCRVVRGEFILAGATFTIAPSAKVPCPEVEVRNWQLHRCQVRGSVVVCRDCGTPDLARIFRIFYYVFFIRGWLDGCGRRAGRFQLGSRILGRIFWGSFGRLIGLSFFVGISCWVQRVSEGGGWASGFSENPWLAEAAETRLNSLSESRMPCFVGHSGQPRRHIRQPIIPPASRIRRPGSPVGR